MKKTVAAKWGEGTELYSYEIPRVHFLKQK